MDVRKFREEIRARLEGQYNTARRGMGLPSDEFGMEEDAAAVDYMYSDKPYTDTARGFEKAFAWLARAMNKLGGNGAGMGLDPNKLGWNRKIILNGLRKQFGREVASKVEKAYREATEEAAQELGREVVEIPSNFGQVSINNASVGDEVHELIKNKLREKLTDVEPMEEDANEIGNLAKKLESLKVKRSRLDKQIASIESDMQSAQGEMMGSPDEAQQNFQQNPQEQSFQDDVDYELEEGDEDISAQQGKNLLKFATADKIAASIMNMDDMELADFIENGLKQAGVQVIADNMETAGGGEPVESEPAPTVPSPEGDNAVVSPEQEGTYGQEGNMKLADL